MDINGKDLKVLEKELVDSVFFRKPSDSSLTNDLVPIALRISNSCYIAGYINGRGLGEHGEEIHHGLDRSSYVTEPDFCPKTPEQYRRFGEAIWVGFADKLSDYVDRWEMYRHMFDEMEDIHRLTGKRFVSILSAPDGTYESEHDSEGDFVRESLTIARNPEGIAIKRTITNVPRTI